MQAASRAQVEEYESGLQEMNEILDEEYRDREASQEHAAKGRFQGDGGFVRESHLDEELDELWAAADKVDEPWGANTAVPGAQERWEEDFGAAPVTRSTGPDREEEELDDRFDGRNIVGAPINAEQFARERMRRDTQAPSAQQMEWEALEAGMEDALAAEMLANGPEVWGYPFQRNNPFLNTRHHGFHSNATASAMRGGGSMFPSESVLETEAAVLRDATSPAAWLSLGIKQQQNEREDMAIRALQAAINLDPGLEDAHLALAVSYTNEAKRDEAFNSLERWVAERVKNVPRYAGAVATADAAQSSETTHPAFATRHSALMNRLIALARAGGEENQVDADVQVALGVLFNTSEEYEKAGDCFAAALQTRPDDAGLFNRLGATLANNGKAEEAIQYYWRALELQPAYVRARYNLAISCVNLNRYREAVEHLLGALNQQQSDADHMAQLVGGEGGRDGMGEEVQKGSGVTSEALWDTLGMCASLLQRMDLADFCQNRDLASFEGNFEF